MKKTDDCRIVASGADAVRMLCCFDSPTEMNESVKENQSRNRNGKHGRHFPSDSKETDAPIESEAPEETENAESTAVSKG